MALSIGLVKIITIIIFKSIMNPIRLLPPPDPQHTNTDLRLINKCLSTEHFDPPFRPRNLNELSKVLSSRLSRAALSKEQKQRSHEWLARRDFDIRPMLDCIKEHKKNKEETGIIEQPFAKVTQPTIINQEEYLKLSLDSSLNSMLHHAATSRTIRRQIFSTLLGRLNCLQLDGKKKSERYGQVSVPSAPRNFQKRKKYLDLTVDMLQREAVEGGCEGRLWALTYAQGTDHPIFKILFSQVRYLTSQQSAEPQEAVMQHLLINSLLALQKDFDDELPRSNDGLAAYLEQRYLCKLQPGDFLLDSQFGCIWGKVFLLFRAGRGKELAKILRAYDLGNLADRMQQSSSRIESYRPERWQGDISLGERDVFREQLLFALAGERKFSTPVLSELNSLDSVWILLRNCGIFYRRDSAAFLEIRQQMIDYYMQNSSPTDSALPLAYLLSYDTLFLLGIHQLVDKDDYLHLLVTTSKLHPCLCPDRAMLTAKLTQALLHYLQQLVREDHTQPILQNYLVLFPQEVFLEEASSLITSNKIYSKIRWEALQELLPKRFIQLLRVTTEKYVEESGDFLAGAQNLMIWMGKQQEMRLQDISASIDMLLLMLIRNCNNSRTYDAVQVKQALNLIRNWITLDPELSRTYHYAVQMFENERQLSQFLLMRNYAQLRNFLETKKYTIFFNNIDFERGRMFQKLAQLEGSSVFFSFLRKVLRAADLVFTQEGPESKSRDIRYEIKKMCQLIQKHERFGNVVNQQSLEALIFSVDEEIKSGCSLFE